MSNFAPSFLGHANILSFPLHTRLCWEAEYKWVWEGTYVIVVWMKLVI